jgi:putative tryptophan/tyrosine transport system substrate-binding protein
MLDMRRRWFITLLGGAAAGWPLAARGQQQSRMRRIGVLMAYAEDDLEAQAWIRALLQGLKEHGWIDGSTASFDYRWARGNLKPMGFYAAELMALNPDLIVAAATPALEAVWRETRSVPIVFVNVADPIGQGFVAGMAHPGGNVTGFTSFEFSMGGKWVEVLKEISPSLVRIVVTYNPATAPYFPLFFRWIETAAPSFAVKLIVTPVHDAAEIEHVIATAAHESNSSLIVVPSAFMTTHRELIIGAAARHRLPAIYGYGYYAASGGLVSYGFDVRDLFRRAASYVDRILKGAKPADLPVQAPTTYQLVINLRTAKALGLTVPETLLARADEVIE